MATSGGGWLYDQLREIPRGADPGVLVEWSDIIQKKANEGCKNLNGSLIRFKGNVNDEGRFALDLDAADPDSMVCLLDAIQNCLTLMPTITREFYGALMVSLASEAEEKDELSKDEAS
jgi:hypothetical protein